MLHIYEKMEENSLLRKRKWIFVSGKCQLTSYLQAWIKLKLKSLLTSESSILRKFINTFRIEKYNPRPKDCNTNQWSTYESPLDKDLFLFGCHYFEHGKLCPGEWLCGYWCREPQSQCHLTPCFSWKQSGVVDSCFIHYTANSFVLSGKSDFGRQWVAGFWFKS